MEYRVTIRWGTGVRRYHLVDVEADDAAEALRRGADAIPPEILPEVDLVEVRPTVDPASRPGG